MPLEVRIIAKSVGEKSNSDEAFAASNLRLTILGRASANSSAILMSVGGEVYVVGMSLVVVAKLPGSKLSITPKSTSYIKLQPQNSITLTIWPHGFRNKTDLLTNDFLLHSVRGSVHKMPSI